MTYKKTPSIKKKIKSVFKKKPKSIVLEVQSGKHIAKKPKL
jgi:hypothetical protein